MSFALTLCLLTLAAQEEPSSFGKDQRVVASYYYWGPDDPPRASLLEMAKAGVDLALLVSTGAPEAIAGLPAALESLEKDGKTPPRLAPAVQSPAEAVVFFKNVPRRHWASIDGRPLVWLLPTRDGKIEGSDVPGGRGAFLVADATWKGAADRTYVWGASHAGPRDYPVVSVGPGSTEPPRDREDGKFYERSWFAALRLEPRMVVIETWNGPGNGVSETPARARKYLDMTARFIRHYKVNEKITLPKGKFTGAARATYTLQYNPREQGLRPVAAEDGPFDVIQLRGIAVHSSKENRKGTRRHLYFDVDDSFCYFDKRSFQVSVEFLDSGEGTFALEYDSGDKKLSPAERSVKPAGEVPFQGTGEWKIEKFALPDAIFGNGQAGGADFRLSVDKRGLTVRRVWVDPR